MTQKQRYYGAQKALRDLVLGIEAAGYDEEWDAIPEAIYDAYVSARALLGSPVVTFPGGVGGEHFHLLRDEGKKCDLCSEPPGREEKSGSPDA